MTRLIRAVYFILLIVVVLQSSSILHGKYKVIHTEMQSCVKEREGKSAAIPVFPFFFFFFLYLCALYHCQQP